MDELDFKIIRSLADTSLNLSETARALWIHRNTASLRTEKIKRITGLDPMKFYDLVKLLGIQTEDNCRNCCHWIERSMNGVKVRNGFCCKCHIISDDDHYCKYWERGGQDGGSV